MPKLVSDIFSEAIIEFLAIWLEGYTPFPPWVIFAFSVFGLPFTHAFQRTEFPSAFIYPRRISLEFFVALFADTLYFWFPKWMVFAFYMFGFPFVLAFVRTELAPPILNSTRASFKLLATLFADTVFFWFPIWVVFTFYMLRSPFAKTFT